MSSTTSSSASSSSSPYRVYWGGELFDAKHLIGNAMLASAVERYSSVRAEVYGKLTTGDGDGDAPPPVFSIHLPQNKESTLATGGNDDDDDNDDNDGCKRPNKKAKTGTSDDMKMGKGKGKDEKKQKWGRGVDIRNNDLLQVMQSDLCVFNFDGLELDSGTVVEFMMAKQCDIPCVLLRTDFRSSGDQKDNVDTPATPPPPLPAAAASGDGVGDDSDNESDSRDSVGNASSGSAGDDWNLMCSSYPRTRVVNINALASWAEAGQQVGNFIDTLSQSIYDGMCRVLCTPSVILSSYHVGAGDSSSASSSAAAAATASSRDSSGHVVVVDEAAIEKEMCRIHEWALRMAGGGLWESCGGAEFAAACVARRRW